MRPTIPTTRSITTGLAGLAGGPNWTTVSLLNGALTREALAAIHNRNGPADPAGNAIAPQRTQPVIELRPALATASPLQSAA